MWMQEEAQIRRELQMPRNRDDRPVRRDGYENENQKKKTGMNTKKVFAISFCIVLGIVFISGGLIYKLGHDMYLSLIHI
mgnify:CR=1 FL=1